MAETAQATGFIWMCGAPGRGSPSSPPAAAATAEEEEVAAEVVGVHASVGMVAG